MKLLLRKGKHWTIPINGQLVEGICIQHNFLQLHLDSSRLISIESNFVFRQHNSEEIIDLHTVQEARKLIELYKVKITEATAFSTGELFLKFSNSVEIFVEDGPYENWHYYENLGLAVHGGVGGLRD